MLVMPEFWTARSSGCWNNRDDHKGKNAVDGYANSFFGSDNDAAFNWIEIIFDRIYKVGNVPIFTKVIPIGHNYCIININMYF